MSLAAINSQYIGLNGLSGALTYNGGAYGLYSNANIENAKTGIANAYDLSATSNSYSNKASVSSSSFSQQCQAIEFLLQENRIDDAMEKYDSLYNDMASNSYYQGYTENEIKTLLQEKYIDATGTTLVKDISENPKSSFAAAFESSIPIVGMLYSNHSSDEFIAKATGTKVSELSKTQSALGVLTGTAASAGTSAAVYSLIKYAKKSGTGSKTGKILAACAGAAAALLTYFAGRTKKVENN